MAQGQDAGGGDLSYQDRGADNIEDLTRSDEAAMDRVAQAGVSGAFGEGDESLRETMRHDAEEAFGGDQGGGESGS